MDEKKQTQSVMRTGRLTSARAASVHSVFRWSDWQPEGAGAAAASTPILQVHGRLERQGLAQRLRASKELGLELDPGLLTPHPVLSLQCVLFVNI